MKTRLLTRASEAVQCLAPAPHLSPDSRQALTPISWPNAGPLHMLLQNLLHSSSLSLPHYVIAIHSSEMLKHHFLQKALTSKLGWIGLPSTYSTVAFKIFFFYCDPQYEIHLPCDLAYTYVNWIIILAPTIYFLLFHLNALQNIQLKKKKPN